MKHQFSNKFHLTSAQTRRLSTLLCCFFITILQSQELKTIELLPPESVALTDLAFLKSELKDAQVVMLGEHTHMHGNIFEMKARVVEYLHQELGFNTFAMESPMYEIWKMNQKGYTKKGFNDAVFSVWSETSEFQRLVNYIDENKLKVVGFDSQVNDVPTFIDDFFDYCQQQQITLRLDQDDMGIIMEGVLTMVTFEEHDIKFKTFENELNRIVAQIEKLAPNETNYYWKQFTKSLLACSQDAYNTTDEILTTVVGDKTFNIRDKQMADNLLSYISRNPKEKIIVWADNIHLINDNSSITKPIAKDFIPMGSYIKKALKDKVYSLATIHSNDSILNKKINKWIQTPILENAFEYELKRMGKPYLFISSNQDAMKIAKNQRLLDFVDFTEARLDQLHDGYIFLRHAIPAQSGNDHDAVVINAEPIQELLPQDHRTKSNIFKGQVLDEETKESIPFATLIIKKDNIYRVADEHGRFELPVKNIHEVEISSIGYAAKKVFLQTQNDKIYLKSQFEQLAEVLVTRKLSPKAILKKAVMRKGANHPTSPFNFKRYSQIQISKNDVKEVDLELLTTDYSLGYLSPYITTQRVEQVKWNAIATTNKYKTSSQFFGFRENAIQYANILHKRKYKKFQLSFVTSEDASDKDCYIIEFQTSRNKWNYTNKSIPTAYSGRVYIDKENFAILRVVENWETALNAQEIEKYFRGEPSAKDIVQMTIKEENAIQLSKAAADGKYYATHFSQREIIERLTADNILKNSVVEINSNVFDYELNNVQPIEYEHQAKENTKLNRVEYDKVFWDAFYENDLSKF